MHHNNDISALFDGFQGDARVYREFVEEAHTDQAKGRWPLIAAISATPFTCPPPCVQAFTGPGRDAAAVSCGLRTTARPGHEITAPPVTRQSLLASLTRMMTRCGRRARA